MDREQLYHEWQRNKHRPAWVREHRDELHEYLSVNEEIPTGPLYQVRDWVDRYAGTVTRQLNDDTDESDPHDAEDADGT